MRFDPTGCKKYLAILNIIIIIIIISSSNSISSSTSSSSSSSSSSRTNSFTVFVPVVENVDYNVRTSKLGKKTNSRRICYGILFEDVLLEDQDGDGRLT